MKYKMQQIVIPVAETEAHRVASRTLTKIRNICERDDEPQRGAHVATLFVALNRHAWLWFQTALQMSKRSNAEKIESLLQSGWKYDTHTHEFRPWLCPFMEAEVESDKLFSLEQAIFLEAAADAWENDQALKNVRGLD